MQVKTEVEGVYRDIDTGALLNTDGDGLAAYKKIKKRQQEIEEMRAQVIDLKHEMSEIKTLLKRIIAEKT